MSAVLFQKGTVLLNTSRFYEALQIFGKTLIIEPNNVEALVKKGIALTRLREIPQALDCFDKALRA